MSKRLTILFLAAVAAAVVVAAVSGMASASSAAPKVVPIVMHDPGCHWFQSGSKFTKAMTVKGKTTFRNLDEAALIFVGKNFRQNVAVGKTITIAKAGVYHITMVKQAPDDNHLLLVVK